MIEYHPDVCGCNLLCRIQGGMYGPGLMWGLPSALLTYIIHDWVRSRDSDLDGVQEVWKLYSGVLSFLIVFRTMQAINRFWAGAEHISQAKAQCVAAVSNLFAYCIVDKTSRGFDQQMGHQESVRSLSQVKTAQDMRNDINEFKATVISLVSMFFAQTLQMICTVDQIALDVIGGDEVDQSYIDFLASTDCPSLVVLHWLENIVMDAHEAGLLRADPPLLARIFQLFSEGMVALKLAAMINEIPVPFPYDQVIQSMLVVQTFLFPVVSSLFIANPVWAAVMNYIVVSAFWQLIYIAREIDHPFGDDPNDLNIAELQADLNSALLTMIKDMAQVPPEYKGSLAPTKAVLRHSVVQEEGGFLDMISNVTNVTKLRSNRVSVAVEDPRMVRSVTPPSGNLVDHQATTATMLRPSPSRARLTALQRGSLGSMISARNTTAFMI